MGFSGTSVPPLGEVDSSVGSPSDDSHVVAVAAVVRVVDKSSGWLFECGASPPPLVVDAVLGEETFQSSRVLAPVVASSGCCCCCGGAGGSGSGTGDCAAADCASVLVGDGETKVGAPLSSSALRSLSSSSSLSKPNAAAVLKTSGLRLLAVVPGDAAGGVEGAEVARVVGAGSFLVTCDVGTSSDMASSGGGGGNGAAS